MSHSLDIALMRRNSYLCGAGRSLLGIFNFLIPSSFTVQLRLKTKCLTEPY
ncbi:hypothetical protein JYQ62_12990 [Nostoc sp. UHCC 0702]|nr:hypothetical protein JYQ62_12990 [Nostoc sp. UHCC 0702]